MANGIYGVEDFGGAFDPALVGDVNLYNASPEVRSNYVEQARQAQQPVDSRFALSGNKYVTDDIQKDLASIFSDAVGGNLQTVDIPKKDPVKRSYPALDVVGNVGNLTTSNAPKKKAVKEEPTTLALDPIDIDVDFDDSPYVRDMSGYGAYLDALARNEAESQGRGFTGNMERTLAGDRTIDTLESDRRLDQQTMATMARGKNAVLQQANIANQLQRALGGDAVSAQAQSANLLNTLARAYAGQTPKQDNTMRDYISYIKADPEATIEEFIAERQALLGR